MLLIEFDITIGFHPFVAQQIVIVSLGLEF